MKLDENRYKEAPEDQLVCSFLRMMEDFCTSVIQRTN